MSERTRRNGDVSFWSFDTQLGLRRKLYSFKGGRFISLIKDVVCVEATSLVEF